VAVASMVAASMAGSDMWRTGFVGVKLAAAAYLLPFLWVFNPALILDGTPTAVILAVGSASVAAWMLARALQGYSVSSVFAVLGATALTIAALFVGGSTLWLGPESVWVVVVSFAGIVLLAVLRYWEKPKPVEKLVALDTGP